MKGLICPYCDQPTEYADSKEVYGGVSHGMIYICRPCKAWVGVHHRYSEKSLGRVADATLRRWKMLAHDKFDTVWTRKIMKRGDAYRWLSRELDIPKEYTHIGMFSVNTCKKVIELCEKIIGEYGKQESV